MKLRDFERTRAVCKAGPAGLALLLALSIGGCGWGSEESEPIAAEDSPSTVAAPPAASEPAAAAAEQAPGVPPTADGKGGVELETVGEFDQPVYVTQPEGDEHLYVVEQCGTIQRVPLQGGDPELFLDVSGEVTCGGEQGLLSVAFAPSFESSGLLYVYFTDSEGSQRVVEYTRAGDGGTADPESARELLVMDDFASNHNGGLLVFGPDGELYAGTGDGGGGGDPERNAQDPASLLGKLLRIDTDSGETEIAALGLRNPWRYSFDRKTGDLWIGDVGQDALEEIDAAPAEQVSGSTGELNFGWSAFEGSQRFNEDQEAPGALGPVLEYGRDEGCSVTGGYVVRDPELPTLYGRYLYGDYCAGELRSFTADPAGEGSDDRALGIQVSSLSSFGEDAAGRVYVTSLEGSVSRLVARTGS